MSSQLFKNFIRKAVLSKQGPPGPAPREGLQWKPQTHRWIRPKEQAPSPIKYPEGWNKFNDLATNHLDAVLSDSDTLYPGRYKTEEAYAKGIVNAVMSNIAFTRKDSVEGGYTFEEDAGFEDTHANRKAFRSAVTESAKIEAKETFQSFSSKMSDIIEDAMLDIQDDFQGRQGELSAKAMTVQLHTKLRERFSSLEDMAEHIGADPADVENYFNSFKIEDWHEEKFDDDEDEGGPERDDRSDFYADFDINEHKDRIKSYIDEVRGDYADLHPEQVVGEILMPLIEDLDIVLPMDEEAMDNAVENISDAIEEHLTTSAPSMGTSQRQLDDLKPDPSVVGEEWKTSLRSEYQGNESRNRHSENYLLLAETFGSRSDVKKVKEILSRNARQGFTSSKDNAWMYENINPYYQLLED